MGYIPLPKGFVYLFAIINWYSRFVLNWQLSNTLDTAFCIEGLERALAGGKPTIFNSDQGVQFTSKEFTNRLLSADITISMDGRGRALDNIFVERLWRTVKYEDVYPKCYETPKEVYSGLRSYSSSIMKRVPTRRWATKRPPKCTTNRSVARASTTDAATTLNKTKICLDKGGHYTNSG